MRKLLLPFLFLSAILVYTEKAAAVVVPPVSEPLTEEQKAVARSAFEALKSLPKKERMSKLKQARQAIRDYKAAKKAGKDVDTSTLILVILAILLPPLAVYLHEQEVNTKFWVTLLLFLLGLAGAFLFSWLLIFAAVVYALLVVLGAA
ncbi:MAG: YqaE/Pmp3 family membrane protein [Chitinophagaceae bacterium]